MSSYVRVRSYRWLLMDLFDMFVIPDPEPETTQEPPVDLVNELDMIIQKHGLSCLKMLLAT
ncbi:hypothetical protein [Escherichia phage IME08]|uniref:Uncharacterized protein modA.2 n=1 Tax=Escherichia phage IME08 TaxID=698728 RepID=D7RM31_9CAUD|nr:hypothetical protein IME08_gp018 [Escherichia phage IME08]ADI55347.1 hypothetical protein [Escherichia phage IME08]